MKKITKKDLPSEGFWIIFGIVEFIYFCYWIKIESDILSLILSPILSLILTTLIIIIHEIIEVILK